jgi:hypothetical protein
MAIFIVIWPYLLTTKLRFVIRHNLGHSIAHCPTRVLISVYLLNLDFDLYQ